MKLPLRKADRVPPKLAPHLTAYAPLNLARKEGDDLVENSRPFLCYVDNAVEVVGHYRIVSSPNAGKLRLDRLP